jgi:hypothetical protein
MGCSCCAGYRRDARTTRSLFASVSNPLRRASRRADRLSAGTWRSHEAARGGANRPGLTSSVDPIAHEPMLRGDNSWCY